MFFLCTTQKVLSKFNLYTGRNVISLNKRIAIHNLTASSVTSSGRSGMLSQLLLELQANDTLYAYLLRKR